MENKKLFEKVKKLKLPKGKYALFGSSPMAIRGLRECKDVDIIVLKKLFDLYKQKRGWQKSKTKFGSQYLAKGNIELFKDWKPGKWNIKKLIRESEIIDGLPFVRLKEVIKWKKLYGREKDLKDIKMLENKLKIGYNNRT